MTPPRRLPCGASADARRRFDVQRWIALGTELSRRSAHVRPLAPPHSQVSANIISPPGSQHGLGSTSACRARRSGAPLRPLLLAMFSRRTPGLVHRPCAVLPKCGWLVCGRAQVRHVGRPSSGRAHREVTGDSFAVCDENASSAAGSRVRSSCSPPLGLAPLALNDISARRATSRRVWSVDGCMISRRSDYGCPRHRVPEHDDRRLHHRPRPMARGDVRRGDASRRCADDRCAERPRRVLRCDRRRDGRRFGAWRGAGRRRCRADGLPAARLRQVLLRAPRLDRRFSPAPRLLATRHGGGTCPAAGMTPCTHKDDRPHARRLVRGARARPPIGGAAAAIVGKAPLHRTPPCSSPAAGAPPRLVRRIDARHEMILRGCTSPNASNLASTTLARRDNGASADSLARRAVETSAGRCPLGGRDDAVAHVAVVKRAAVGAPATALCMALCAATRRRSRAISTTVCSRRHCVRLRDAKARRWRPRWCSCCWRCRWRRPGT